MSKTIQLGTKSDGPALMGEGTGKPVKHYPQISIPGADCEDVPNTGTATITFRLRRIDRGKEGSESTYDQPNVDIEVRSITFPGKAEGAPAKKSKGMTESYIAKALAGTAADNGEEGSPSAEAEGDGDETDETDETDEEDGGE